MHRILGVTLAGVLAAACSPTFNWREVRAEGAPVQAVLPCKPDRGSRSVQMAGKDVQLQAMSCDTGGATFAVLYADLGDPALAAAALDHWRKASLASLRAGEPQVRPFVPPGGLGLAQSARVSAQGQRADGTPVRSEAAYAARGPWVVQAVVYAAEPKPEWLEPFFQGLKLQ